MGNYIFNRSNNLDFKMSNGGLTVFLTVLGLSGTLLANTKKEKELILWLMEHDIEVRGLGNGGFDVEDMPWDETNFEMEKEFLMKVVMGAKSRVGWDSLDYAPNEELVRANLDNFIELVRILEPENINKNAYDEWINEENVDPRFKNPKGYPKCEKHGIFLYWNGCIACNDI
ncbi:hypothetical protein [Paenibacillus roseipurpureus]|uniref:Uncharacterized protein n=1 Tax=Paenibacillus roseopurpureus TaxID=2918901 RepID=A0AA96LLQ8_9BACL|nr:hypothetical protein [Paenibacillus sp. MBLB1832]WNR42926.1 hypothetical protein MJB10_17610 [Paenibacillus sp. MBLB1832]